MRIKTNLLIALFLVISVMLITVGYLGWSSLRVNYQLRRLSPAIMYLEGIAATRAGMTRQMKEVIDSAGPHAKNSQTDFKKTAAIVEQGFSRWEAAVILQRELDVPGEDDDLKELTELRELHAQWQDLAQEVIDLNLQGKRKEARLLLSESSLKVNEGALLNGIDDALEDGVSEVQTEFHYLVMTLGRLPWFGNQALRILERTQATVNTVIAVSRINAGINKQARELMDDISSPVSTLRPFGWSGNETQASLIEFRRSARTLVDLGDASGTRLLSEALTLERQYRQFTVLCQQAMLSRQVGNIDKAAAQADVVIDKLMKEGLIPNIHTSLEIGTRDIQRLSSLAGWQGIGLVFAGALLVIGTLIASLRGIFRTFATLEEGTSAITAGDLGHRINLPPSTELGRLAASFNTMTDTLQRSRTDLEQLNTELEQRVQERTAQLATVNADLRLFSSSVSHDLRTPLSAISGYSQLILLEQGDSLSPAVKTSLQHIVESAAEMSSIIDALLKLGRITEKEIGHSSVDLTLLATHIAADLKARSFGRQIIVEIEDGMTVQGDEQLLRLALENLLGNAWKFTAHRDEARITVASRSDEGGATVYYVQDNGAGFDMGQAGELFKPFSRLHTDEEFGGTGIGLATVQRIIARHGGRIWAEGAPDSGATFFFTLEET